MRIADIVNSGYKYIGILGIVGYLECCYFSEPMFPSRLPLFTLFTAFLFVLLFFSWLNNAAIVKDVVVNKPFGRECQFDLHAKKASCNSLNPVAKTTRALFSSKNKVRVACVTYRIVLQFLS